MNRSAISSIGAPNHAVVLTPTGRGAVAVVLVYGPHAVEAVDAHFVAANGKPLAAQTIDAIRFGHWCDKNGEEIVVCRRQAPQSGTRDSTELAEVNTQPAIVEIHCHGGHAAAAAIVADLVATGSSPLDWQQWLQCSAADPIAGEAQIALTIAPTERTAAILLDQYYGALDGAIQGIIALLDNGDGPQAARKTTELLARAELGGHLTEPWRVVLTGPPNVGKSSLINAMLGYTRSIVFEQPGTTRDVVTARTAIHGWPVELTDTAGLRASDNALESAGVELATNVLSQADLVILVSDATQPDDRRGTNYSPECDPHAPREEFCTRTMKSKLVLRVRNKIDLAPGTQSEPGIIDISALTGIGIEKLLDTVAEVLVADPPKPGTAIPFTPSQQAALEEAQAAITARDAQTARSCLQAMLARPAAF